MALSGAQVAKFVRAIAVLALDADGQIAWLASLGPVAIDELALEFDDGIRLFPQFLDLGWLRADLEVALADIDRQLLDMSDASDKDLWSAKALATDTRWADLRLLARSALNMIH